MRAALIILVLILACVGMTAWYFWQDMQVQLNTPLELETDFNYTIRSGMHLREIADDLHAIGLLRHPHYLIIEARLQKNQGQIKAGEYQIAVGATPLQLLDQFVQGKVVQHSLTLVEGWNFAQVMHAVKNNEKLIHTLDSIEPEFVMDAIQCPGIDPEGQLFPDTYHFPSGTTDVQFLKRAYDRMQHILNEEWQQRAENLPYQSPEEALIMASIIEKETGVAAERGHIAGVFIRRLEKGMLLQTDPTVIYAMGKSFDGNIRRKDLDIDSPYNTYRYAGLPPTPIALAGREAIHAALHPEDGNTLYFVAKGDGSHYFSSTLREHNNAVIKYQLKGTSNSEFKARNK